MKRTERFLHDWTGWRHPGFRSFFLLSAAFVLGAFLGIGAAALIGEDSCCNLELFFTSYAQLTPGHTYTWSNFAQTLWYFLKLPPLFFFVGFSALGVFVIPCAMLLKGFSFSFAVSALVLLYSSRGLLAAAAFFGIAEFVFIPLLFLIAVWSQSLAGSIISGRGKAAAGALRSKGALLVTGAIFILSLATFLTFRPLILLLPQYAI